MNDLEEVLGIPKNNNHKIFIEDEISRLRNLIDLAQNPPQIIKMVDDHSNNKKEVYEELVEDALSAELNIESYNELVEEIQKIKALENDNYDSDNDSFISASESIDLQVGFFNVV